MPLITRQGKGSKLTIAEMDGNLIYLEDLANTGGFETITIDISSSEILGLGGLGGSIELLPAPGGNKYYTWYGVLEFFPGSNTYSVSGPLVIKMDKSTYTVDVDLESPAINIATCNMFLDGKGSFTLNKNVTLDYTGVSAITGGNGTLKVKITYKINEI
jgi:hypothetical protein